MTGSVFIAIFSRYSMSLLLVSRLQHQQQLLLLFRAENSSATRPCAQDTASTLLTRHNAC